MNPTTRILGLTITLLACACSEPDDASLELHFREGTAAPVRPPGGTGYVNNGLHDPQIGGIDPAHPLSTSAGLDGAMLDDPQRLATAKYVVECALPEGAAVTTIVGGVTTTFEGALGLAPEWEGDACDEDCQEWVTACLLARTNVGGQTVPLWLKGDHPALGSGTNLAYPVYEASFFGNLFADPHAQYVCRGPVLGSLLAQLEGRTCSTIAGGYCNMTMYASCTLLPLLDARCMVDDPVGNLLAPNLVDCKAGSPPSGPGMRTISSYVQVR